MFRLLSRLPLKSQISAIVILAAMVFIVVGGVLVLSGAKVIAHARYAVFQMAEVAVPYDLFRRILDMIDDLRPRDPAPC
ncbi:MAG: hypothetical protein FD176_2497 [Rhodospirillaceae bacterium]|nr:MAG: hypothetical protein FD176_2497 [Rhodospirillaceae bacterium]TNC93718.1 MAG: hypothetical protein FD119_3798 [Stygiobacter sp.]